jgi:predicted nucleotidyltransferase
MIDLAQIKPEIERICRSLPVKRLGVFGSAITDRFSPESDVDVLVLFDLNENVDFFDQYFDLRERLAGVFGREIDLTIDKPFRNPFFRASVEKNKVIIYER